MITHFTIREAQGIGKTQPVIDAFPLLLKFVDRVTKKSPQ
jgi:hypothetical protein